MDATCDLLVIGGGMAGLVAGITTAEANASTIVVRKGEGATSMSSGAIDFAGYLRGGTTTFLSPLEGVAALSQVYPSHPYALLSSHDSDSSLSFLQESVTWLTETLIDTPSELCGKLDTTIMALTVLGTRKPTTLVQTSMYTDRLDNDDETLLFAGIKGLPDFVASAASKSVLDQVISSGIGPRKTIHTNIECAPFQKRSNISPIELARFIDTEEGYTLLSNGLKKQIDRTGATLVAVPPVLGLKAPVKVKETLQQDVGAEVFELLSFPPSVPGYRLQRSLESALKKAGGHLLLGHQASSFNKKDNHITDVTLNSPRRKYSISPKSVILATGKYAAGGLVGDANGLHEVIFNLPVLTGVQLPVHNTRPRNLTRNISIQPKGHTLFECGVGTDSRFHPTDSNGEVFAENMFAAGSILGGYNYPVEKSGLGVALTTGRACGKLALDDTQGGS